LAAATGSASGKLVVWQAFGAVLAGMVGGGLIQFALARGPARNLLYRFGGRIGLTPHRLDLAFRRVESVGVIGIAMAVITPGIRTAAIPACGLTRLPSRTFAVGLTLGTAAYIAFQFFAAYGIVKVALSQNKVWLWLLLIPVALVIGWTVYRHRTRHLPQLHGSLTEEDAVLRSYHCPLCWFTAMADRISHPDQTGTGTGDEGSRSPSRRAAAAPSETR